MLMGHKRVLQSIVSEQCCWAAHRVSSAFLSFAARFLAHSCAWNEFFAASMLRRFACGGIGSRSLAPRSNGASNGRDPLKPKVTIFLGFAFLGRIDPLGLKKIQGYSQKRIFTQISNL